MLPSSISPFASHFPLLLSLGGREVLSQDLRRQESSWIGSLAWLGLSHRFCCLSIFTLQRESQGPREGEALPYIPVVTKFLHPSPRAWGRWSLALYTLLPGLFIHPPGPQRRQRACPAHLLSPMSFIHPTLMVLFCMMSLEGYQLHPSKDASYLEPLWPGQGSGNTRSGWVHCLWVYTDSLRYTISLSWSLRPVCLSLPSFRVLFWLSLVPFPEFIPELIRGENGRKGVHVHILLNSLGCTQKQKSVK